MPIFAWHVREQFRNKYGRDFSTDLETATAVVDWVAAVLRHPYFYPEDPAEPRFYQDQAGNPTYGTMSLDPVTILNFTMTFDPNDSVTWPSPLCTYQAAAAAGILNYFGLHARLVDVEGHTGLEYFSYAHHRWVWMDPTFNEHYVIVQASGETMPLGVKELNTLTLESRTSTVQLEKHGYPSAAWPSNTYLGAHPHGFRQFAVTTHMQIFDGAGSTMERYHTLVYSPPLPPDFVLLPGETANFDQYPWSAGWYYWPKVDDGAVLDFPVDGIALGSLPSWDPLGYILVAKSYLPFTTSFEIFEQATQSWVVRQRVPTPTPEPATSEPMRLGWESGLVRVRARDDRGNVTQELVVRFY